MTYEEWADAFNGFGGDAGARLKQMMYEDWTSDRKEQYRAGIEALLSAARE